MTSTEISALCEQLPRNEKLRLAQLLIMQVMREEDIQKSQSCIQPQNELSGIWKDSNTSEDIIDYVVKRLLKLKPTKKASLINSIVAMFQFQGGISEPDVERIISVLQKLKYIHIDISNKVTYR